MAKSKLSPKEILEIIVNTQYATTKDMMKISGRCRNYVLDDKKEIEKQLKDRKNVLPSNGIPMELVVDYYHININYLKKVANIKIEK